jgi:hypothetical protein
MKDETEVVMWAFHQHSQAHYEQGRDSKEGESNPHKQNTNAWYSWNKGYNLNH